MNEDRFENHEHPEVPPGTHPEYPEQRLEPRFRQWWVGGWFSPIAVTFFTVVWTLLIWWLIRDRPRDWQYGVIPYVPGESIFSIEPQVPERGQVPAQVILPQQVREEESGNL